MQLNKSRIMAAAVILPVMLIGCAHPANDGDTLIDADDPGCNMVNGVNGEETGA